MMKMIDEYKSLRIGDKNSTDLKKKLEADLVELFYLWTINNKGLKYIKHEVRYIWQKKMKRIQMAMDDVDSDMEEEVNDIKLVQDSIDIQELNLIKLSKLAFILSSPDIIELHAYHWAVLEEEINELIDYSEWADTLAVLMTSFLKTHGNNEKSVKMINKLYEKFEKDFFHELEQINVNIWLRLTTEICKNANVLGKDKVENLLEYLGYILFQDLFNRQANDREFEEFCIALLNYMPGETSRTQFRVMHNKKSLLVLSLMVKTIEQRIRLGHMNKKSLVKIIFHSIRNSFDYNVNYLLEPDIIKKYFLKNLDQMDTYDLHVLWMTIWDWPEWFREEEKLQNYIIDRAFWDSLRNTGEDRIFQRARKMKI
jgi:hypothetical protein